jgi:hypothetical protein
LHTFEQHGQAEKSGETNSSTVSFTRGIDGDVTFSKREVDSNVMAPYALTFGVTFLWKDAKGVWARVFDNDHNYDRVTCV